MPEVWIPGAAEPSLDDFVERVHRQIASFTDSHGADQSHVEVELGDGERFALQAISPEPGYGFVTLTVHPEEGAQQQVIVPVAAIRRITLGPAEKDQETLGFALPPTAPGTKKGAKPAA